MTSQNLNCCLPLPSPVAKWCRRYCKYCRWPPSWLSPWPPAPSSWARTCVWCSRCPCFHRPRIHPEQTASSSGNNKVVVRRLNSSGSGGGVTNLSFQADDTDPHEQSEITFNSSSVLDDGHGDGEGERERVGVERFGLQPPQPQKEWAYKRHASSLYLKTGPGKCIHVVHVKVKPESQSQSQRRQSSQSTMSEGDEDEVAKFTPKPKPTLPNGSCAVEAAVQDACEYEDEGKSIAVINGNGNSVNGTETEAEADAEEEEDDEEYWFSKWSNRPKLKHAPTSVLPPGQIQPASGSRRAIHRLSISSQSSATSAQVPYTHTHFNNADIPVVSIDQVQIKISTGEITTGAEDHDHGVTNLGFQLEQDGNGKGDQDQVDGASLSHCSATFSMQSTASDSEKQFPVPDEIINLNANAKTTATSASAKPYKMYKTSAARASTVNGAEKECEAKATTTRKPPLLFFVHGLSASSDVWTAQFEHFHARGFELVAIDLLGHGLSSAPPKAKFYTFESLLQDVVYVYDYFVPPTSGNGRDSTPDADGQSRATATVLIGHGYGCCLTRVLSRLRPNQISALVSLAGGGPTPLAPPGTLRPPTLLPFQIPNIFAKKRSSARFDPPELRHVLPTNVRQHLIDGQIWLECDSAFHHRIQIPTLLVYGLRDTTVALVEECEMEKAMPKAFLELLPAAGHFPMLDEPHRLNRMMEKFLQAWLPTQ